LDWNGDCPSVRRPGLPWDWQSLPWPLPRAVVAPQRVGWGKGLFFLRSGIDPVYRRPYSAVGTWKYSGKTVGCPDFHKPSDDPTSDSSERQSQYVSYEARIFLSYRAYGQVDPGNSIPRSRRCRASPEDGAGSIFRHLKAP